MTIEAATQALTAPAEAVTRRKPGAPSKPAAESSKDVPKILVEEAVRHSAYLRWEAAGKPDGDELRFWLEAEKDLTNAH